MRSCPLLSGLLAPALFAALSATAQSQLYVPNQGDGTVGKYDAATGAAINASFISGLEGGAAGVALDCSGNLYVASGRPNGIVGKYDAASGAAINASLVTGVEYPLAI